MPNPRPLLALALALTLTACAGAAPSGGTARTPPASPPSGGPAASLLEPTATATPTEAPGETGAAPTDEPVGAEPSTSAEPGGSASPGESVRPSASPVETAGPASACSGNPANRKFYSSVAAAVDWTLLCAVLPKGWFVSAGSYRAANGGKMVIGYKGPSGATIELSEGAFCADTDGCLPSGVDGDDAPLGPLTGTLVRLSAGGYAIVVDRGLNPSWQLVTHGLDEATTLAMGAALTVVAASS